MRYELQKLRCSACGEIFTASLPPEASEENYSARARAVLGVSRYDLGLPFYRLQGYPAMLGVPVPDSTPWDQIEKVGDWCYVVFEYLEFVAAQGEVIHQDDTSVDCDVDQGQPSDSRAGRGSRLITAQGAYRHVHHRVGRQGGVSGPSVCTTRDGLMRGRT